MCYWVLFLRFCSAGCGLCAPAALCCRCCWERVELLISHIICSNWGVSTSSPQHVYNNHNSFSFLLIAELPSWCFQIESQYRQIKYCFLSECTTMSDTEKVETNEINILGTHDETTTTKPTTGVILPSENIHKTITSPEEKNLETAKQHTRKDNSIGDKQSVQQTENNGKDEIIYDLYRHCQKEGSALLTKHERSPSISDMSAVSDNNENQRDSLISNELRPMINYMNNVMRDVFYDPATFSHGMIVATSASGSDSGGQIDNKKYSKFLYDSYLPPSLLKACLPPLPTPTDASSPNTAGDTDAVTSPNAAEADMVTSPVSHPVTNSVADNVNAQSILKSFIMFHLIEALRHYLSQSGDIISDYELVRYILNKEFCILWLQQHLQQKKFIPPLKSHGHEALIDATSIAALSALSPDFIASNNAPTTPTIPINPLMVDLLLQRRNYLINRLYNIRLYIFRIIWRILCIHEKRHYEVLALQQTPPTSASIAANGNRKDGLKEPLLNYGTAGDNNYDHSDTRGVTIIDPHANQNYLNRLVIDMYEYSVGVDSCTTDVVKCCCLECRCCAGFMCLIVCPIRTCYITFCCPCYCYENVRCRQHGAWSCSWFRRCNDDW